MTGPGGSLPRAGLRHSGAARPSRDQAGGPARVFAFQDVLGPVEVAFTDRHGGTSAGPFASLNLAEPGSTAAGGVHDEREAVRRNVEAAVGALTGGSTSTAVRMRQVHGA